MTRLKRYTPHPTPKRTSAWTSLKASVTIEAALSLPLFFFAVLSLIYLLELSAIQTSIRGAAYSAAKEAAKELYLLPVLNTSKVRSDIAALVGPERLERSIVAGGASGITCGSSYATLSTGEIHVTVSYQVDLPFPAFIKAPLPQSIALKVKGWTGYAKPKLGDEDDSIVYITDTALVYHEDYQCTYLQLSIQFVPFEGVSELRNKSGGKYHGCEKCVYGQTLGGVYITETGNKYHNSLGCSGLKRTIYAVHKGEVAGKGGCSRCSQ